MKKEICRSLISAAALALIVVPGLASCSKVPGQGANEQNANEPAVTEQDANTEGESAQNAKALLKAMSDYLAAQKAISLSYDYIFKVVGKDEQKLQLATSSTAKRCGG